MAIAVPQSPSKLCHSTCCHNTHSHGLKYTMYLSSRMGIAHNPTMPGTGTAHGHCYATAHCHCSATAPFITLPQPGHSTHSHEDKYTMYLTCERGKVTSPLPSPSPKSHCLRAGGEFQLQPPRPAEKGQRRSTLLLLLKLVAAQPRCLPPRPTPPLPRPVETGSVL